MAKRKTWREKLADSNGLPKVGPVCGDMSRRFGEGIMVIPAPSQVDAIMRTVPEGKLTTVNAIRERLALEHGADFACPMTTGIFAWIAAHAAEESAESGESETTPYWRTLKTGGELNPKYPGGIDYVKARLQAEGHRVIQKGKRFIVEDYESKLAGRV